MEFIEKPPSQLCLRCGLSVDSWDVTSTTVHDKETPVHMPFTYKPKQHFLNWLKRLQGKLRSPIPPDVIDRIYLELDKRRIHEVQKVTWHLVDNILRILSKRVDKHFTDYYPHVYQITNIIRGAPVLTLSDAQVRQHAHARTYNATHRRRSC